MKQVIVLRHANWHGQDELTDEAAVACTALSASIGDLSAVYASPTNRAKCTAELVSGRRPLVDERAAVPHFSDDQLAVISKRRPSNPLGIVGVIREEAGLIAKAETAGEKLAGLIKHVLEELQDSQRALIVSHDGTMAAAEQALNNQPLASIDHSYTELEGYVVDDQLHLRAFHPSPSQ